MRFKFLFGFVLSLFLSQQMTAQNTSDAVYTPQASDGAKFYSEFAGTSPKTTFELGEPIFVQFLFKQKVTERLQSGEQVRAGVYKNGKRIAVQLFKPDDEVLAIYFSETYSLDLPIMLDVASFNKVRSFKEADLTDRILCLMTYTLEGMYDDMFFQTFGRLGVGNHALKAVLEVGKVEEVKGRKIFVPRTVIASGDFTLKATQSQMEAYREEVLEKMYGEVLRKEFRTAFASFKDKGVGELHKKYMNKVVFSNKPVDGSSDAGFKNSFTSAEDVYMGAFLPKSVGNLFAEIGCSPQADYSATFYLDGKEAFVANGGMPVGDGTTFTVPYGSPVPNKSSLKDNSMTLNFAWMVWNMPAGKHKIKVEFYLNPCHMHKTELDDTERDGILLGTGEFDFTLSEADRVPFAKARAQKLPALGDAGIAAEARKASGAIFASTYGPWDIRLDAFGRNRQKVIDGYISKKITEKNYILLPVRFAKDWTGSDWGALYVTPEITGGSPLDIPSCNILSK